MLGIRPGDLSSNSGGKSPNTKPEKSPQFSYSGRHRGSIDWSALGEASTSFMNFTSNNTRRSSGSEAGFECCEDGDSVGALPESKPPEKPPKKHGSFRLSFKRRDTGHKKISSAKSPTPQHQPLSASGSISSSGQPASILPSNGTGLNGKDTGPLPAKFIRATSVKPKTLSPKWHERFRFDCDDSHTDFLHLDIWDHDDEASVMDAVRKLNEVKGMRGLGRYFKQVAQSARSTEGGQDDFLGSLNIPVREVPATGCERWYKLEGRTNRSNIQGTIRLKMWLATREDRGLSEEEDMWNEIRQHQQIFAIVLHHQLDKFKDHPWEWDGDFPEAASSILQQHAIQGDLTDLQVFALRWRALAQQAKDEKHQVHFKVLYDALRSLEEHWDRDLLSTAEERALGEAFSYFVEYGLLLLQHHQTLFPPKNKLAFERLEYLLRCFYELSEMKVTAHCYPQAKNIRTEVAGALKKGVTTMFLQNFDPEGLEKDLATSSDMEGVNRYRAALNKLSSVLVDAYAHLEIGYSHYNAVFETILRVGYTSAIYKQYDKLIAEEMCPLIQRACERDMPMSMSDLLLPPKKLITVLKDVKDDEDEDNNDDGGRERKCSCVDDGAGDSCRHFLTFALFEVCLALREVFGQREHLVPMERKTLQLTQNYHDWFVPPFAAWLAVVSEQMPRRVEGAVECDRVITSVLHPELKHTSSSRDVTSAFYHVKDLWTQMGWKEAPNNRSLLAAVVDIICKNASLYTELVYKRQFGTKFYNEGANYKVSEELCITMNNIEHVCQCVITLPNDFGFSEERSSLSSSSSINMGNVNNDCEVAHPDVNTNDHLLDFVVTTIEYIDLTLYNALESIAEKLQNGLKKHIFHLAWSPESLPTVDAISPLLGFLDQRFQELNGRLLRGNLIRVLHVMWETVLTEIEEHADTSTGEKAPSFFDRLYEALHILEDFFSINGGGLSGPKLYTDHFNRMELFYSLNRMSTERLVDLYHRERLNDQQQLIHQYQMGGEPPQFGMLSVRVYFHHNCLFVEIIRAREVIPLDANGLSDPFVIIELLPKSIFQCSDQQTHVQKATLNPVFDECFEFAASSEQCKNDDAMLHFSVYDHDVLTFNDFGGEAFFSLKNVPGVQCGKSSVGNFHGLKQVDLGLMFQENKDHPVLNTLATRTGDKVAIEFVKKQKERVRC